MRADQGQPLRDRSPEFPVIVLRLRNTVLDEVGEFGLGDGGYLDGLDGHDLVLVQRQRVPDVHLRLHVHPKLGRCAE